MSSSPNQPNPLKPLPHPFVPHSFKNVPSCNEVCTFQHKQCYPNGNPTEIQQSIDQCTQQCIANETNAKTEWPCLIKSYIHPMIPDSTTCDTLFHIKCKIE